MTAPARPSEQSVRLRMLSLLGRACLTTLTLVVFGQVLVSVLLYPPSWPIFTDNLQTLGMLLMVHGYLRLARRVHRLETEGVKVSLDLKAEIVPKFGPQSSPPAAPERLNG